MSQGLLSKKDLLLTSEGNSNITDRIKNFLPKIAKANKELELADEETKKNLIMEKYLKELTDDESEEEENDETEESKDKNEQDLEKEENHVCITFTTFKDDEEKKSEEKQDFIIRKSEGEPVNKKSKIDND